MDTAPRLEFVSSFDGAKIAVHRLGRGFPVVMLHGFVSNAQINWLRYGHAALLAEAGFEAIMIEMRAHGQSDAPQDASAYPKNVQLMDVEAVRKALDITDHHLVGYSLGGRIAAMLVAQGLRPQRLVIAGMGLKWLINWAERRAHYLDLFGRLDGIKLGDADYLSAQFIRSTGVDPVAISHFLRATGDFAEAELARITMPTLVVAGDADLDVQPVSGLSQRLVDACHRTVPGNHMSAVTRPELGLAIRDFLIS